MEDKKKYVYMENVLQGINKNYISLPEDEVKRNNKVLEEVLNQIITKMKEKSALFKYSYSRVFYGGSYYDGLRVGNPEEFDLDLLMTLPKYAEPDLTNSNIPGFVHLQLKAFEKFEKQPEAHRYNGLANLLDNQHFLVTTKVSAWIEGLVNTALNDFPNSGNFTIINTSSGTFQAKIHKGGPAHTLKLTGTVANKKVVMDVDLVPCFVFTKEKWPPSPYRKNPVSEKTDFFIVPKKPSSDNDVQRYWRLSFQEQERVLINSSRTLKPTIKLLKKLRDSMDHKTIASYYIKTVFLWEVENNKELWNHSLSYVFMFMLKKYKQFLDSGKIPYFWNKNNNLLKANPRALENIANKLRNIIDDIEKHPGDPYVVAKYLVQPNEIEQIKSETVIGKKTMKQLQQLQISSGSNNGMASTLIQNTVQSSTNINVDKLKSAKTVNEIAHNYFQQNHTLLQSEVQLAIPECINRLKGTIASKNNASCTSDEVDSVKVKNFTESAMLKAINKLQDSTNNLTLAVTKLQSDNQKMLNFMESLSQKIDNVNTSLGDLKMENRMLKNQLKEKDEGSKDVTDDVYFLSDRLLTTCEHKRNLFLD